MREFVNSVEYIQKNKHGETISLYAAFDIYFVNKKSVREYEFYDNRDENEEPLSTELVEEKAEEKRFRVQLLYNFVELLKLQSILEPKGEVEKKKSDTLSRITREMQNLLLHE